MIKWIYGYDDKGNRIRKERYDPNGNWERAATYKYDVENNQVEKHVLDTLNGRNITFTYRYTCDQNDNWIRKMSFRNGSLQYITKRKIKYFDE